MEPTADRMPHMQQNERSVFALFSDLFRETSTLVHQEVELARTELSQKVSQVKSGITELAVGGLIAFAGFIVFLIAIANGLARLLPPEQADWLAPLIVGVVVMIIGAIALMRGKRNVASDKLAPQATLESMRRDSQMMKDHATKGHAS